MPNIVCFYPKGLSDSETPTSPTSKINPWSFPIGLGLVDALNNESKNDKKSFLFGSQLKIQVPSIQSNSISSPRSPIEFGVKTKDTQLALLSPLSSDASPPSFSPQILTEMELSEDYTCVISHGPNPKTTHIFDNCIVESCNGFIALRKEESGLSGDGFLSFCDACKKNLSQGKDIFMYRGEKGFCSEECRRREMLFDKGREEFSQDLEDLS